MSFLQPFLLVALPLVGLPILIHLINQRRFQTIRWAAMMFLLAANRMSRGYAKLRQWLILLFRMLAIAGLIFAVSRPLASGWLGLTAGGRPDTTMILLDRSPSMQQQGPGGVGSKLQTGRSQLARTLNMLGSNRWILIENTSDKPREMESPDALLRLSAAEPNSASADLPAMLQVARDYIQANKSGRTEVWICSDIRANDWNAESGRWQALRDSFSEFPQGLRFHLLAYPQPARQNVAIRVTGVRRQQTGESAELLVSLRLTQEHATNSADLPEKFTVPIQFEIEGARSEVTFEMTGPEFELQDHRIPLERQRQRGWGKVSIPADANPADNEFYFAFDQPVPRRTIIVADDPQVAQSLQLAASISSDADVSSAAEVVELDRLATAEWDQVGLLLWQAPLPVGEAAKTVEAFMDRGGYVIFFPPRVSDGGEFAGVRWQSWSEPPEGFAVQSWRGDHDLLAHTQSGAALPVGQLKVRKACALAGEVTALALLTGEMPLLGRVTSSRGGVYFCTTTPAPADSTLASDGIVFYVMVQRALAAGASKLGNTRQLVAGEAADEPASTWRQVTGPLEAISSEYPFHEGVYSAGDKLFAVNRSQFEDQAGVLADARVAELFKGLDFVRVDDQAGNLAALIQEIWRAFLFAMMVALIAEAALSLPRRAEKSPAAEGFPARSGSPSIPQGAAT